jgi:hypothetical protein
VRKIVATSTTIAHVRQRLVEQRLSLTLIRNIPVLLLAQSVTLTDFGGDKFAECVDNVLVINEIFSRHFGQDKMSSWIGDRNHRWEAIFASARYFTNIQRYSLTEGIPFEQNVDPDGVLGTVAGGGVAHCEDNQVEYRKSNGIM